MAGTPPSSVGRPSMNCRTTGSVVLWISSIVPSHRTRPWYSIAMRVPTANVSVVDLVAQISKKTTPNDINNAFRAAAAGPLKGILAVSDEPLVSVDYIGSLQSSVIDALSTAVVDGRLVYVTSWYDNEMGYSARCVDLLRYVGERL